MLSNTPYHEGIVAIQYLEEVKNDCISCSRWYRRCRDSDGLQFHLQRLRLERAVGMVRGSDLRCPSPRCCSRNRRRHGGELSHLPDARLQERRDELRRDNCERNRGGYSETVVRSFFRMDRPHVHVAVAGPHQQGTNDSSFGAFPFFTKHFYNLFIF